MGFTHRVWVDTHECNYPNGSYERPMPFVGEGSIFECDGCGKEWMYMGSAVWEPTVKVVKEGK